MNDFLYFHKTQFRLKSCGLKKLIYLVEQYGSVEHFPVPESTLKQAIMNTQVLVMSRRIYCEQPR